MSRKEYYINKIEYYASKRNFRKVKMYSEYLEKLEERSGCPKCSSDLKYNIIYGLRLDNEGNPVLGGCSYIESTSPDYKCGSCGLLYK